jgi:hypothetical protein
MDGQKDHLGRKQQSQDPCQGLSVKTANAVHVAETSHPRTSVNHIPPIGLPGVRKHNHQRGGFISTQQPSANRWLGAVSFSVSAKQEMTVAGPSGCEQGLRTGTHSAYFQDPLAFRNAACTYTR